MNLGVDSGKQEEVMMKRVCCRWFSPVPAGMVALIMVSLGTAQAQVTRSWNNAAGGNWSLGSNWDVGTTPSSGDKIIFNIAGTYTATNDLVGFQPTTAVQGFQMKASGGTVTLTGNSFTLAGSTEVINTGTVVVHNNVTLVSGCSFVIGGTATFTGILSGSSGSYTLIKKTTGTLVLNNDNNSFGCKLEMREGVLEVTSIGNTGVNSALGSGSTITISHSTVNATLRLNNTTAAQSTSRQVLIGNNQAAGTRTSSTIINNNGNPAYSLTFANATFNPTQASVDIPMALVLGGVNSGDNRISGKIQDNSASGPVSLTKTNSGTWILNGINTYTGLTSVNQGTLGGAGRVAGNMVVASNAKLSPGSSAGAQGTFSVGGDLALNNNAVYEFDATDASVNDTVAVTGSLTLGSGIVLNLNTSVQQISPRDFTLFTFSGPPPTIDNWVINRIDSKWYGTPQVEVVGNAVVLKGMGYIPPRGSVISIE